MVYGFFLIDFITLTKVMDALSDVGIIRPRALDAGVAVNAVAIADQVSPTGVGHSPPRSHPRGLCGHTATFNPWRAPTSASFPTSGFTGATSRAKSVNIFEAPSRDVIESISPPPLPKRNQWTVPAGR